MPNKFTRLFEGPKDTSKETNLGKPGYDNPRENIDPHVKTKVLTTQEIRLHDNTSAGFVKNAADGTLSGGNSGVDLSAVAEDIIPALDDTYDLGSLSKKWAQIWTVLAIVTSIAIGGVIGLQDIGGILFINASTLVNGSLNVTNNINTQNITANNLNGSLSCRNIVGGSDSDFCADLNTGGGGSGTTGPWNSSGNTIFLNNSGSLVGIGTKPRAHSLSVQRFGNSNLVNLSCHSNNCNPQISIENDQRRYGLQTVGARGDNFEIIDLTDGSGASSVRFTIATDGSVGFGTTTPDSELTIVENGNVIIALGNTAGGGDEWSIRNIVNSGVSNLDFRDNDVGNVIMTLEEDGDVGIGIQNPTHALVVIGDANVTGNLTANLPHGEMFIDGDVTTVIGASGQFFNVTINSTGDLNGFNHDATNGILTALQHGDYFVTHSESFTGGANDIYDVTLAINLIPQVDCETDIKLQAGGNEVSNGGSCLLEMENGDELRMMISNQAATADATFKLPLYE